MGRAGARGARGSPFEHMRSAQMFYLIIRSLALQKAIEDPVFV